MSLLVVGLSHRSAPVALLEQTSITGDDLVKLLHEVNDAVSEVMIVSTCNRVEVYASVDRFHGGVQLISEALARHSGVPLEELSRHLYVHYEDRAVQHAFTVACGLESMVVGEGQILGQIRAAFRLAQTEGTIGRTLHEVVQRALRVGKRAHSDTGIDQAGASLVSVGLQVAENHLGDLSRCGALVIGAGAMSGLAVATLARAGVAEIVVANRTYAKAERLADSARTTGVPARALRLEDLDGELNSADLIVSCTGAGLMISREQLVPGRRFILDLALPHDVDPEVRTVEGTGLAGLEDLRTAEESARAIGPEAVEAVRQIVADEVSAFLSAARAAAVAPTVVALRTRAAEVVELELARLRAKLPDLDPKTEHELAMTVRRVADKLLHAPTVRVKELAASPGGDSYADALRELFDLDPSAPQAVTRADLPAPKGPGRQERSKA